MITPRSTRLIRVRSLRAFREAIPRLVDTGSVGRARRTAVLVPSRSAAEHLRRAFEDSLGTDDAAVCLPHIVTRGEWLAALRQHLPDATPLLAPHEREVMLESSAREAAAAGFAPPFRLRAGIVGEMLAFYDAVRRHGRGVEDLDRAADETFTPYLDTDGGAARVLDQAHFLAETFRRYESRVAGSGRTDEHDDRERLLRAPDSPFRHVVIAVGDAAGDEGGLWPADFDLLTRLPGLDRIEVLATDAELATGLLPRLRRWLPGLSEERDPSAASPPPTLVVPHGAPGALHAHYRDREEEIAAVARRISADRSQGTGAALSRTGVVFRRPLPYVYLAARTFSDASLPYDTFDTLPLAAEPYAAALDLVIEGVEAGFTRESVVAILRSPHFGCAAGGRRLRRRDAAELDAALSEARFLGDAAELRRLTDAWLGRADPPDATSPGLRAAARAAADVVAALAPLAGETRPAAQIETLVAFLDRFERIPVDGEEWRDRHVRARAAVRGVLAGLRDAHRAWNDDPCAFGDTASRVRRWIEQRTFSPRAGTGGVQLLDASSARFAALDRVFLVGLVRPDWPDRVRRSIFFPTSFLKHLGWPEEADTRAELQASFEDLVTLAGSSVWVSTFLLDNDAIVEPSPLLDGLEELGLPRAEDGATPSARSGDFSEPTLTASPGPAGPVRSWMTFREGRTSAADPRYHGRADGAGSASYRVSAIDRYLDCPFKYFAADVLRLRDEPADEPSLGPRARGQLTHEVFERFFEAWQQAGHGAVTVGNIGDARTLFAGVVEDVIAALPPSDATLQRANLLGSPLAPGAGEILFQYEIEHPAVVVERLLEFQLDGDAELRGDGRTTVLRLRARADRIDLLDDGTFRVLDYKLSKAPDVGRAIQLPAYAAAARSRLQGHRGREWRPSDAVYVTLGRPPNWTHLARGAAALEDVLREGEGRLVAAVDGIDAGRFPPRPADVRLCATCPFAGVCRKDYVDA